MATMNISLPDAMKEWIEDKIGEGQYANASDYVRDLVRLDQKRAEARENLDRMVEQALASGIVEISREDLLARMKAKRLEAIAQQKSA